MGATDYVSDYLCILIFRFAVVDLLSLKNGGTLDKSAEEKKQGYATVPDAKMQWNRILQLHWNVKQDPKVKCSYFASFFTVRGVA